MNEMNHPIKLQTMRVQRTYTGGKLLDQLQSVDSPVDGDRPEEWIASTITSRYDIDPHAGLSVIAEGPLKGCYLRDIIALDPVKFLGQAHVSKFDESLGFLAKLIDPDKRLNIQTHPDNEKAREYFNSPFGKTEAWYIIDTRIIDGQDPFILIGFKPGITKKNWIRWIENQDIAALENSLHKIPVEKGEVFFIESGMPHAIGPGCFLAEIQEPTDYTFRVEKMMQDDKPYPDEVYHQGIGYDKMYECFHYEGYTIEQLLKRSLVLPRLKGGDEAYELYELLGKNHTTRFSMDKLIVNSTCTLDPIDAFRTAVVLSGKGTLCHGNMECHVTRSTELFFPVSNLPISWHTDGPEPLVILLCNPPESLESSVAGSL
jgi:mannose-6-phosphate isomerase